jgi:hypothetical protein
VDCERGSLDDHIREGGEQDELGFGDVRDLSLEQVVERSCKGTHTKCLKLVISGSDT